MDKIMKLAALMREVDKLSKELIDDGKCEESDLKVLSANFWMGKMEIHVYNNIKALAEKFGRDIVRAKRNDDFYPYEDSITVDGVKFYEILTEEEATA